jgi:hypothetical protein
LMCAQFHVNRSNNCKKWARKFVKEGKSAYYQ